MEREERGAIRTQNPTGKSRRSLHVAKEIPLLVKHKKRSPKKLADQQRREGGWGGRDSQQKNGCGAVGAVMGGLGRQALGFKLQEQVYGCKDMGMQNMSQYTASQFYTALHFCTASLFPS